MGDNFWNLFKASTNKITNLGLPTLDTDAATKKYVDDEIVANVPAPDNLGDHRATQKLDLGTNVLVGDNDGVMVIPLHLNVDNWA